MSKTMYAIIFSVSNIKLFNFGDLVVQNYNMVQAFNSSASNLVFDCFWKVKIDPMFKPKLSGPFVKSRVEGCRN